MSRLPLLLLALTVLGCSPGSVRPVPDQGAPTRVQARIEVDSGGPDQRTIDFGEVDAGASRDAELRINNIGSDTLVLEEFVLSNEASFQPLNLDELEPFLAPDSSWFLRLRYAPSRDESLLANLIIASNDRTEPEVAVLLRAEGLAPAVDLDPDSFDFGDRELGCVGALPVAISNLGRAPLVIDAITFDDLGGEDDLVMQLPSDYADGYTIEPGDPPLVLDIVYSPGDVLPDTGSLTVLSNDPLRPEVVATQFGIAHLGEQQVDSFAQTGDNKSDILFVVDNSGSMGPHQANLATNFSSFVQIVEALDIDYQIGVVTTDVADGGALQGTTPIITRNTPDPAGTFSANVNLGTSGSAIERGYDSAYLALSSPNIDPGGPNAPFLRDDAGLRIIFVSDEQEQSTLLGGGDPAAYVSYFRSLKANPDHVVLSDITGGLVGCGTASSGSDYVLGTALTNGISALLCDANWVSALTALAWLSQSSANTFELSRTPVPGTVEVRLSSDGISYVPVYTGWAFSEALNAVVFDLDHVPDNGDFIDVGYAVQGDCEG